MKGLLMKDLLNLKQTIRVWALLLALFIVIGRVAKHPNKKRRGKEPQKGIQTSSFRLR